MTEYRPRKRVIPRGLVLAIFAIALVVGVGTALLAGSEKHPSAKATHAVKSATTERGRCGSRLMAGVSRQPLSSTERYYGDTTHVELEISPEGSTFLWSVSGYEVTDVYGWESDSKKPVHAGQRELNEEEFTEIGLIQLISLGSKPIRITRAEICLVPLASKGSHPKIHSS